MKHVYYLMLLLAVLPLSAQETFRPIDTTAYLSCRTTLGEEYRKKFDLAKKGQTYESSAQKSIIKTIYTELQEDFLQKIKENDFVCDEAHTTYLRGLMDEILEKNGIEKASYRLLLSKSPEVNAYNTGDGTVVMNYGLFLLLDNEDEVVFVMAHEIGHQFLNHVRNNILQFAKISTSEETVAKTKEIRKQKYGKGRMATSLLKNIMYRKYDERRRDEIAADSIGMVFYGKTGRNTASGIRAMDKLDIADDERDSLDIADYHALFDKGEFRLKNRYFERETSLFTQYDKDKRFDPDSLKSHPACAERIKLLKKDIENGISGRTVSPKFDSIKKYSPYQSLYNQYSSQDYGMSLYEALKLYRKQPDDAVLKTIILANLLKLKEARVAYTINRHLPGIDNKDNSDSLNRFITFIHNIKLTDFDILISQFQS